MSTNGSEGLESGMPGTESKTVRLAEHFTRSKKFRTLFAEGMDLVEDTANFLDGEGRILAKQLSKDAQTVYGTESMRLTTRLMQLASWLLLQRAVADGEMSPDQALEEKKNVKLGKLGERPSTRHWSSMPEPFTDLVEQSLVLQQKIVRLDRELYEFALEDAASTPNAVAAQQSLLETAFDTRYSS